MDRASDGCHTPLEIDIPAHWHLAVAYCSSQTSAVALNWGWDTNAIFGHVDPHPRVECACAGSYGHVFSSNPCGLTFRGNEDAFFYSTRSVST